MIFGEDAAYSASDKREEKHKEWHSGTGNAGIIWLSSSKTLHVCVCVDLWKDI